MAQIRHFRPTFEVILACFALPFLVSAAINAGFQASSADEVAGRSASLHGPMIPARVCDRRAPGPYAVPHRTGSSAPLPEVPGRPPPNVPDPRAPGPTGSAPAESWD